MRRDGYNVVFPPDGRQAFDGGMNSKFERALIAPNESPDCQNVVFANGAVATREAATQLNTTAVGSFVCDGIYTRRANTGAETMVAWFGGTAWNLTGTSTFATIASAQSVYTAGQRVGAAQYENHIFFGNGGTLPYKWNGTDFTRHGVYPPTQTATAASIAGTLSGDQSYKMTYVNSQLAESDLGPATTFSVTATGGGVRLSSLPVAPQSFGVSSRRIYRYDSGSYKRVGTIGDNTTTTFDDAGATAGATAPTDNGVPPLWRVAVAHQDRLFMIDATTPNQVWYSNLGEPYTVASTNFDTFGDASADLPKALEVYDNSLVVICENSQWVWYMPSTTVSDWRKVKVRSSYGSRSPYGAAQVDGGVMFPAIQNSKLVGFGVVSGDTLQPSTTLLTVSAMQSDLASDRIEPEIFDIQEAYVSNISAFVFRNKAYLAVTYGSGATTNNRVFVYDFSVQRLNKPQRAAWTIYKGANAAQFTVYDGKLYFGSATANGLVYRLEHESVYTDAGSAAIDSYFWTKEFAGLKGHENLEKDFRWAKVLVDMAGAYYMTMRYRTDSDSGDGQSVQLSLNPGSMIWGTGVWGQSTWGSGSTQKEISVPLGQCRGKRIQFQFSNQNTAGQRFKVHGLNFTYNVKGER